MRGAARRSWLFTGFSPGETMFVFGLLGVLVVAAVRDMPGMLAAVKQTEGIQITTRSRLYWVERWANDGLDVPATAPDYLYDVDGRYSSLKPDGAADGSITVSFEDRNTGRMDAAVTFRPAFSARVAPFSLAWICGAAEPPPGFTAVGANRTTLPNERLVTGCRRRP